MTYRPSSKFMRTIWLLMFVFSAWLVTGLTRQPVAAQAPSPTRPQAGHQVYLSLVQKAPAVSAPVINSFNADPPTVTPGGASTLRWNVTDATSLSISGLGAVTGVSVDVQPAATTVYTLTATNGGGSTTATATVTVSGGTRETGAFWLPYTTLDQGYVGTAGTNIAVDAQGGIHMTYGIVLGQDNGQRPAYYIYCPTNCADPNHWTRTRLSDNVFDIRLQLDPAGHPRVMIYAYVYPDGDDWGALKQYKYGACDNNCTDSANWTITPVASAITYDAYRPDQTNHYFALDAQGHPAFIYGDTTNHDEHGGTFYLACRQVEPGNCTNAQNWQEVTLSDQFIMAAPELAFTPGGDAHLLGEYVNSSENVDKLVYGECTADCTAGEMTFLYNGGGYDSYSLRLDRNGRPRVVFYTGNAGGELEPYQLYYLWCDTDCTAFANWRNTNLHTHFGHGWSVDLELDSADHPRFVYKMGDEGPGYAWCDVDCESDHATWQAELVENRQPLQDENPVQPFVDCSISTWTSGHKPALALDAQGNPRLGFDTMHQYAGVDLRPGHEGETCPVSTDIQLARFLMLDQP